MPTRRTPLRLLAALVLVVAVAVTLVSGQPARAPSGPLAVPDAALDALWAHYGDQGGHWTGGDRTASVALPDGRTVWLFSDTFLGQVLAGPQPAGNRPGRAQLDGRPGPGGVGADPHRW